MKQLAKFSKHTKSNHLIFYQSNSDIFIELRNNDGLIIDCFPFHKDVFKKVVIDNIEPIKED